jgi:hypothetical protein
MARLRRAIVCTPDEPSSHLCGLLRKHMIRHLRPSLLFPSILALAAWLWFSHHPVLILATGYSKTYWFESLNQVQFAPTAGYLLPNPACDTLNWDGTRLHIESGGYWEDQTYAPRGAFIIAALPHGIGLGWHARNPNPYDEMDGPYLIPYWLAAVACLMLPFCVQPLRHGLLERVRIQRGQCPECGYDLTGNTSGVCPECGEPVDPATSPS